METLKRLPTILHSLWHLLFMSKEEIDSFVEAHDFFAEDYMSEEHMAELLGEDYIAIYQKSQRDRYHVLNYLCALGAVEKMYSPPLMDETKSPFKNQMLFEDRMIDEFRDNLTTQGRILDLGCGRGIIASHVYRRTGKSVVGVNIDPTQIKVARAFVKNMRGRVPNEFVVGDFNAPATFDELQDGTFDVAYQVQSLSCVHNKPQFFRSVNRCLRVGGRYAILCYVRNPHYDRDNPTHYDLMAKTKSLMAAIYSPLVSEYIDWLEDAGFRVVHSEDLSVKGETSSVILFEALNKYYTAVDRWVSWLTRYGLAPRGMTVMLNQLNANGEAWYEADRLRLVAPTWYLVADKVRDVHA